MNSNQIWGKISEKMWIEKQNGSQIILNKSKRQKKLKILKNRKKMLMPVMFSFQEIEPVFEKFV